ncbi:MAG: DUF2797 domain-containing protein [Candidatus Pelagadaptatus aseana]|uniref:DUF2797 domain-containing protein n=1 Tax=Candidatus Pelagadaptatus aseana TaxID=3120508 RepID=UPI0039B315F6
METNRYSGHLRKMATEHTCQGDSHNVQYQLVLDEQLIGLNQYIGSQLSIHYDNLIHCIHCGRKSNKSFSQGYCYPCFKKLAQCDSCIMSPEKCHYDAGTCREPEWADEFCMTDHIVYLANSSGIKVGITRLNQVPTRWMDQGAKQALPIFRVATRQLSGFVEDAFREYVGDRTNWRALLKGDADDVDLAALRDELFEKTRSAISSLQSEHGVQAIQPITDGEVYEFSYPVATYPDKIKSHNLDKTPQVSGLLQGIKGQYLILDTGVINLRKFTGYQVDIAITP